MNISILAYLIYLAASIALTIWVARTLHRNGHIFLVHAFRGNETMAASVNHLLLVGFYLVNLGFVALALRYGTKPTNASSLIEFLSTKLGLVMLVLGAMHFFNMFNFDKMRRKGLRAEEAAPRATPPTLPGRA